MRQLNGVLAALIIVGGAFAGARPASAAPIPPLSSVFVTRFVVHADICATDLGGWAKVAGLGDSTLVTERRPGADASYHRWYLPGGTKYSTVKLTRAAGNDSQLVQAWLSDATSTPATVTITLMDSASQPLATWTLQNVVPVKWSIAGFDAGSSKIAVETLELSHQGIAPGQPCSSRASSPLP